MVDYSKWKDIEISDDEDDTHPNIDKHSLFKWRHEARVQRMKEFNDKKQKILNDLETARKEYEGKKTQLTGESADEELQEVAQLEEKWKKAQKEADDIKKQENLMPWNVDTISKEGWSKTKINKSLPKTDKSHLSEEEKEKLYLEFIKANEKKIKHYGMLSKYDDCRSYLLEEPQLCCEETAKYLTLWCLNLEIEEKHDLMERVSVNAYTMRSSVDLAKETKPRLDPVSLISNFFRSIQTADKEYVDDFESKLKEFRKRIKDRAKEKIEQAYKEVEAEERQKRLGPGGLDPADVFETLPDKMKKCFEESDLEALKDVIAEMTEEEAKYHMKRCVDSGLWIPGAKAAEAEQKEATGEQDPHETGSSTASETLRWRCHII